MNSVYLLHFSPPYRHAGHYVGYTTRGDVHLRLDEHSSGRGARLCRVAVDAGCTIILARVWENAPRKFERTLKKKGLARACPVCSPATAMNRYAAKN